MRAKFVIVLVLGLILFSCQKAAEESVEIGVILPLTGPAANLGEWVSNGLRIAEDELNLQGGIDGKEIVLKFEDDECGGQAGVASYNKLVNIDEIEFIIGPLCNAASIPIASLAEEKKIIAITVGVGTKAIREAGDYTFNILPELGLQPKKLAEHIWSNLDISRVSIIYALDEYGEENQQVFAEHFTSLGGEVITVEGFDKSNSDYRSIILKIKQDSSQGILIIGYSPHYINIIRQLRENKVDKHLFAVSNIQDPAVFSALGEDASKIIYTYPEILETEKTNGFLRGFNQLSGQQFTLESLPMYAGAGYDALHILAESIGKCGESTECVQKEITQVQDYPAINGVLNFNEQGNVNSEIKIKIIR